MFAFDVFCGSLGTTIFENSSYSLESHYSTSNDFKNNFQCFSKDSFSIFHLNIRNMNKSFVSFKEYCLTINFKFSIACFSETRVDAISFIKNSNFQLSGHKILHKTRKNRKGGGICVFVREYLSFKLREDLSINCDVFQSLSIVLDHVLNLEILFSILSTGQLTVISRKMQNSF